MDNWRLRVYDLWLMCCVMSCTIMMNEIMTDYEEILYPSSEEVAPSTKTFQSITLGQLCNL